MDYCFVRREDEEHYTTILVLKHRQSRAVRSWVVPRKGSAEAVAAELANEGLRGFGVTEAESVTLKCDNEAAVLALRRRVAALWPGPVLEQGPAPHEHESNGIVESGVKIGKGVLRVHLLSLESRIGGRLPCGHPVFAWLVQHAPNVLTKGLVGKDGRTPYSRLFGKEVAEEGLEFGEVLRWKLPRLAGHNTLP